MKHTVKSQADFRRIYAENTFLDTSCLRLYMAASIESRKYAIVASKKCGNAVQRNTAKRLLRTLYQELKKNDAVPPDTDLIFIAKKSILTTDFESVYQQTLGKLKRC